ncbi:hypothetical protein Sjap_013657 [Stephania japonica]|uniref:Fe2OG dioxygenase domain-containing protein n=1 Tax=Stephania japonica TaxID=461633 RepID=A0AAP0IZ44_9MAGN
MGLAYETKREANSLESQYHKGVLHLCETGITKIPNKYIFPIEDRLRNTLGKDQTAECVGLELPVIDFAELQGSKRFQVLKSLSKACEEYGFFQVINHGIPHDDLKNMIDVAKQFFELPFEEREKYMSLDLHAPVRYGTSFSQNSDKTFCWRDLLKLNCHPLSKMLPFWPSSPVKLRQVAALYSKQIKFLFLIIIRAVLESLGLASSSTCEDDDGERILKQFESGSQVMVLNCYPQCPEPDLTLGMPSHSDYGFLTILLQDEAEGLQVLHEGKWITVKPLSNSFVVNVGDHLEIFSNGRYKSVLHRVLVNPSNLRVSVASLHSLPFDALVRPSPKLVNEANPRRYKDTDFGSFVEYISTCDSKEKSFLESRKLS